MAKPRSSGRKSAMSKQPPQNRAEIVDTSLAGRLKTIISTCQGIDESDIFVESSLRDQLGMDSLDFTETFMTIESAFDVSLPDDYDFDRLKTFKDLTRFVELHVLAAENARGGGGEGQRPPVGLRRDRGGMESASHEVPGRGDRSGSAVAREFDGGGVDSGEGAVGLEAEGEPAA
jgi:acyl carrier protein